MPTIKSLIADERHAIEQYGEAAPQFRKRGNTRAARLMSHIREEEQEHEHELEGILGDSNKGIEPKRGKRVALIGRKVA